ncbi:lytic transglycosylase domain-containing protein [Chelatococcus reniformis]|uniref:Transglycosylase n=1 Tax=Chelatococcus reniformis TaxID=1494448 RepID=A0A916X7S4_9HYPH|nr:transglycosylase [Chelatococcus reniformis]
MSRALVGTSACAWLFLLGMAWLGSLRAEAPAAAAAAPGAAATETPEQAVCRIIDGAAKSHGLPPSYLTRLIYRESAFRATAVSPVGAQGIAQFMPGTAADVGLADPFDPEQAIPKAARFLVDLKRRFGSWGLAAAAYNGGPTRLANWLEGKGGMPTETRNYVIAVTGRSVDEWADDYRAGKTAPDPELPEAKSLSCRETVAVLRRPGAPPLPGLPRGTGEDTIFAPWGVQLAGNFSRAQALATFARARNQYRTVIGDSRPMIIGTRLRSRGTRVFYRIRVPAPTRTAADALCGRIRAIQGACIVLKS